MAIIYNGTTITTVYFNGVKMSNVKYNGVAVISTPTTAPLITKVSVTASARVYTYTWKVKNQNTYAATLKSHLNVNPPTAYTDTSISYNSYGSNRSTSLQNVTTGRVYATAQETDGIISSVSSLIMSY